ncbi:MAG: GNAT family N-acetyltransferase [Planctomycetes bacterium]|nr:GNAT family N-acetyltransferase [Planctomycetota bacterium]
MSLAAHWPPVPVLETGRLLLRGRELRDFEPSCAMWRDPEVVRYIGGQPISESDNWSRFLRHVGHWAALGFGYWVVEERASGRFVGEVGFAEQLRELEPSIRGTPECGWALATWAHGRGYATEAVLAALTWGDTHFEDRRTACIIEPGNAASLRVAAKCGFVELARTTYKGVPMHVFERLGR